MIKLDDVDRKIVAALQENGRISNKEVAELVNLTHSSCSRRIARLEKEGIIVGYRALTDRLKLGYSVRAYCGVFRDAVWAGQSLLKSCPRLKEWSVYTQSPVMLISWSRLLPVICSTTHPW